MKKPFLGKIVVGKNTAGNSAAENLFDRLPAGMFAELPEVGRLAVAEELGTIGIEIVEEAAQGNPGRLMSGWVMALDRPFRPALQVRFRALWSLRSRSSKSRTVKLLGMGYSEIFSFSLG